MSARVLLVEDSALVVGALRVLLEESGFAVTSAATVAEAIAAAERDAPDVMLLDLTLRGEQGLDVLDALVASHRAPRVTIALTGHDEPAIRERCPRAGCRDVLVKPIKPLELPTQINGWLSESAP